MATLLRLKRIARKSPSSELTHGLRVGGKFVKIFQRNRVGDKRELAKEKHIKCDDTLARRLMKTGRFEVVAGNDYDDEPEETAPISESVSDDESRVIDASADKPADTRSREDKIRAKYEAMSKRELTDEADEFGLSKTGNKAELVARLTEHELTGKKTGPAGDDSDGGSE